MSHQTFWKPEKVEKVKKPLRSGPKKDRIVPEWKQGILSHHQSNPSKADRAEFPLSVVKVAIERSGGICQYCKKRPCTSTHHVLSRGRGGRGVLSNAFRACGVCHTEIEGSEEKKQEIITLYTWLYGDYFWYDELDWQEYERKQAKERDAEKDQKDRYERLEPIANLLTLASGRTLKAKEMRLLDGLNEGQMLCFVGLINDVINANSNPMFSDRFED